ncbi:uncharacterized protein LOC143659169 isoform X3 [Tamandua tetradactyla]|uniref:uncharacterized protein LOC143659169 isoform X3 n=1 Tax=Tamandua tetradactyla TaxID=48850 RepID=UPI0040540FF0
MQGSRNPQGSHRNGPAGHCGVHIRASEKGPLQRTPRSEAMCLIPYSKLSSWASTLGPASVLHGAAASEPAGDRHGGLRPTEGGETEAQEDLHPRRHRWTTKQQSQN